MVLNGHILIVIYSAVYIFGITDGWEETLACWHSNGGGREVITMSPYKHLGLSRVVAATVPEVPNSTLLVIYFIISS